MYFAGWIIIYLFALLGGHKHSLDGIIIQYDIYNSSYMFTVKKIFFILYFIFFYMLNISLLEYSVIFFGQVE